jgi:hypothetical protein
MVPGCLKANASSAFWRRKNIIEISETRPSVSFWPAIKLSGRATVARSEFI